MADVPVVTIEEPKVEPVVPVEPTEPKVEPVEVKPRVYSQEELDRITAKVKKNARYQARKEVEAYYQGRDSRPEVKEVKHEEKPPERASFDSYEEFLEAKAAFTGRNAAKEERKKAEQESLQNKQAEDRQKSLSNFQNKVREKYPDLEDRIEAISEISMSESVLQAIAESEVGPDILSYFADNPKDCERIAALSPSSAVREVGKLEARFESKTDESKKEIPKDVKEVKKAASKAPTPINPGGGGSPSDDSPRDADTIDEWIRKERARERKLRA